MQCTVHNRQSLVDIALQECGAFEATFALARRNGVSVTDEPATGHVLEYTPEDVVDKRIVAVLAARGVKPATALAISQSTAQPQGIGRMAVGIDFIVG